MIIVIEQLTADQAAQHIRGLIELLIDAVASGASIGFVPLLDARTAREYWAEVIAALENETRVLFVARAAERIVGTAQLDLSQRPNARHRAEVQKLMVHTAVRSQGIARRLMAAVEAHAHDVGRTTLVLDTRQGDVSEQLYAKLGYIRAGVIPRYAQSVDGTLHTTVFFYKLLEASQG